MNHFSSSQFDYPLKNIATEHTKRCRLRAIHETRTNYDIAIFNSAFEFRNILRKMLAICVKLNSTVVIVSVGVFYACLKRASKTKIPRQVKKRETICTTHVRSAISGSVVNDDEVSVGNRRNKLCYRRFERIFFVICRNDNQSLQNTPLVRTYATIIIADYISHSSTSLIILQKCKCPSMSFQSITG